MGKIYADSTGAVIAVRRNQLEEDMFGIPAGAAMSITFDEETNGALLAAIAADQQSFSIASGALRLNNTLVPIAPASPHYTAKRQLAQAKETLQANASALQAYHDAASVTAAQTAVAVHALIEDVQALSVIIRALIKEAN